MQIILTTDCFEPNFDVFFEFIKLDNLDISKIFANQKSFLNYD